MISSLLVEEQQSTVLYLCWVGLGWVGILLGLLVEEKKGIVLVWVVIFLGLLLKELQSFVVCLVWVVLGWVVILLVGQEQGSVVCWNWVGIRLAF